MRCDRRALPVDDLVEAEHFYGEVLGPIVGGSIANRYGLTTDELIQGRKVAALGARQGEDTSWAALPFSRVLLGQSHIYLWLANEHLAEAPPEQLRGVPRLALSVTPEQMERAVGDFQARGVPFEGPVDYRPPSPIVRALYFRDPSGNFLELCCAREAA